MNLLILYPKLFNVQSKFDRKLKRIIANNVIDSITFVHDDCGLLSTYVRDNEMSLELKQTSDIDYAGITHAILFDDSEEFHAERVSLKASNIPYRIISIKLTRVVNINREPQYKANKSTSTYEYIGRGSYWGNPYSMFEDGDDRDEVIRKYRYDFDYEKFPHIDKQEVFKLHGKRLGCFCKPDTCHGDVLADFLNSWDDGN